MAKLEKIKVDVGIDTGKYRKELEEALEKAEQLLKALDKLKEAEINVIIKEIKPKKWWEIWKK